MAGHMGESTKSKRAEIGDDERDIIPRDFRFDIPGNATRNWFAGDIAKTSMIDAMSIFLPEGERFFIRSLKHYSGKLKDKALSKEINGYAVQEAFHTREHEDYNRAIASLGYDVAEMERPIGQALGLLKNPLYRLAATCAIEHLTASFSSALLRRPHLMDGAHPAYRRLWMWHALEELEHKAVALDVLNAATKDISSFKRYWLRVWAMNAVLAPFLLIFLRNVRIYVRADGVKPGFRFWAKFFWANFGKPGLLRHTAAPLLRYYTPWFDPRNGDDSKLIARGREWLDREFRPVARSRAEPPSGAVAAAG